MDTFCSYPEFKNKIATGYPLAEIDRHTHEDGTGYWLNRGMYRWYRLCQAMNESCHGHGRTLLDVGAFPFTALKVAKVMFPELSVTGAGLWDDTIDLMLKADPLLKDGKFQQCNFDPWIVMPEGKQGVEQRLQIPDESVDFVIFTEVVEHLYNPAHALKEISRVLKPGGRIYLTTNNVTYWFYALRILKGETNLDNDLNQITVDFENEHPHNWRGHVRFYSISQLAEMLRLAGIGSVIRATSYDTTDILPGQQSFSKQVRTLVKGAINHLPFMNRFRGHIEILAEKSR